jgi:hypothetical protein
MPAPNSEQFNFAARTIVGRKNKLYDKNHDAMIDDLLDRLCDLVPPPTHPHYNKGDWSAIERAFGLTLPDDYKRLIETYGQGEFVGHAHCSGLLITSYLGPRPVEQANGFGEMILSLGPMSYSVYPDVPGLLGVGSYGDKDSIAWHTVGDPEDWPIIYHAPETGMNEIHQMGILEFTVSVLKESSPLHDAVIRKGNMARPHTFIPEQ